MKKRLKNFVKIQIKAKRIENYKYSYELQRKTKELKKMEEYFEGLHLIDFEQLKIENNVKNDGFKIILDFD